MLWDTELKKENFTSLCKENSAARPRNMCIIPFCKKLPDTWLVRTRSIVNKVQKWKARLMHGLIITKFVKMESSERIYSQDGSFRLHMFTSICTIDCWSDFKVNTLFLCLIFPFVMTHPESWVDDSDCGQYSSYGLKSEPAWQVLIWIFLQRTGPWMTSCTHELQFTQVCYNSLFCLRLISASILLQPLHIWKM